MPSSSASTDTGWVAVKQYARHRECSPKAVRKAAISGRLGDAARKNDRGHWEIHATRADVAWGANTDPAKQRGVELLPAVAVQQGQREVTEGEIELPEEDFILARTRHEIAKANLAEIELEQKRGTLLPSDAVEVKFFEICRAARDNLLTIPSRVAPLLAAEQDALQVQNILTEEINEALRGISDGLSG